MTRTSSTLVLLLVSLGAAIAAAPATASDEYGSVNAITAGTSGGRSDPRSGDYTSLNAATGAADSRERSPVISAGGDPSSLNAVLATAPEGPRASSGSASDYRSPNAIVGPGALPQQPLPVVEARERNGFDWFDALIGAVIASGLMLMTLAAARMVARHRRATA